MSHEFYSYLGLSQSSVPRSRQASSRNRTNSGLRFTLFLSQCGIPCKVTWFLGHPFPLYLLLITSLFTYVESETLLQSKVNQETSGPGTVRNQAQWTQHGPSHLGLHPKGADVHDTSRLFIVSRQRALGREWPDADPKRVQIVISNIYAQMCSP